VAVATDRRLRRARAVHPTDLAAGPCQRAGLDVEEGEHPVLDGPWIEARADPPGELEELEAR